MIKLEKENYSQLNNLLSEVPFNCFFASSVTKHHVDGTVYVDNKNKPNNMYILHPYGMSLLLGDGSNEDFNNWLYDYMLNRNGQRKRDEWLQVFPGNWNSFFKRDLGDRLTPAKSNGSFNYQEFIEVNTRVNFKFNKPQFNEIISKNANKDIVIKKLTKETTLSMHGSVIPVNFWNNADDFLKNGNGYCVFVNNEQASTAYSAFVHGKFLEIGIETIEKFRGMGYAKLACSALIEYCIENLIEPVWSCRLENIGSYKLAKSLGFEPILQMPYYRLCKYM